MNKNLLSQLNKKINRIKEEINSIDGMRPGSLTQQYKNGKHTQKKYYQLSYSHNNKGHTSYIRDECVKDIKREIKNFKKFKKLTTELVSLEIQKSTVSMKIKLEEKE